MLAESVGRLGQASGARWQCAEPSEGLVAFNEVINDALWVLAIGWPRQCPGELPRFVH